MEAMPYTRNGAFEWEYPARVVSVIAGGSFLADIDLGFGIHVQAIVVVEGIAVVNGLAAKKEAQRLLHGADVILRSRRVLVSGRPSVLCEVGYGPWFEPRSEQGTFAAAMLATGTVRKEEPSPSLV